jgi:hypothetical protein
MAKSTAKKKVVAKKASTKKAASKGKSMKAAPKSKPKAKAKAPAKKAVAKKAAPKKAVAKKAAPKKAATPKKSILKTAGKLASKAVAALTKVDKEKVKKEALKAKAAAQKEKERLKKEAEKAKLQAKKEKELAKKEAEKAKLQAKKEKELAKKEAEKAKLLAKKEEEKAKKEAEKSKTKGGKKEDTLEAAKTLTLLDDDGDDFDAPVVKTKSGGPKKSDLADLESKVSDEISVLREHFAWPEIVDAIASLEFFVDGKDDSCVEKNCDNIRTTLSWCRLHYIKNWKHIQRKKEILKEGRLEEYIEELISKYPPKYIEAIIKDLADDRDFYRVLNELNITSEFEFEEEDFESSNDDDDSNDDIGIEATFTGSMRYEDTE